MAFHSIVHYLPIQMKILIYIYTPRTIINLPIKEIIKHRTNTISMNNTLSF